MLTIRKFNGFQKILLILSICSVFIIVFNYTWTYQKAIYQTLNGNPRGDFVHYNDAYNNWLNAHNSIYNSNFEQLSPRYIYPPPSLLLILPCCIFGIVPSYFIITALNIIAYIFSIALLFKIISKDKINSPKIDKTMIFIILLALAPLVQNIKSGQINAIILLFSILSIFYAQKEKPHLSSLFLIIGFWFKFYPIILLPFLVNKKNYKSYLTYSLIYILGIPLILLPFIPLDLYKIYFFNLFPRISDILIIGSFNQSLSAFLMRLSLPVSSYSSWEYLVIPTGIKLINIITMISVFGLLFYLNIKKMMNKNLIFGFLLSFSCIFSPVGWEYTYTMATLLIFIVLINYPNFPIIGKILVLILLISFLIPKLPDGMIEYSFNKFPYILNVIFYNRFIISLILLLTYELVRGFGQNSTVLNN